MIMDNYEQKYKKALEAVKFLQEVNPSDEGIHNWVKDNFPELKESEDERMWKLIKKYAHYNISDVVLDADHITREYLESWLEKQGEQKPYGQRKECEDCQFNYAGECKGYCQMKRNEHKPTDKVEPKFKVGDWVVSNSNGEVWQIGAQYNEKGQRLYLYNVNDVILSITLEELNNDYHLWTIKDAKDGSILQLGRVTAIFQKYISNGNCKCYCSVYDGEFEISRQDSSYGCYEAIPATKEQRHLFFEKMKEDGWEWDNEKKELKKIKPKKLAPDKVIEWLRQNTCTACWDDPNEAISQYIEQFKKDFEV